MSKNGGLAAIDVYDVKGRRVLTGSTSSVPAGAGFATVDASSLSNGVYFLTVRVSGEQAAQKFVVVR